MDKITIDEFRKWLSKEGHVFSIIFPKDPNELKDFLNILGGDKSPRSDVTLKQAKENFEKTCSETGTAWRGSRHAVLSLRKKAFLTAFLSCQGKEKLDPNLPISPPHHRIRKDLVGLWKTRQTEMITASKQ